MIMKLSVPFIPDEDYAVFLSDYLTILAALYFPLPSGPVFDARIRSSVLKQPDIKTLAATLAPVKQVKKYILMNTRFIAPDLYTDQKTLGHFLDLIADIDQAVGIQGIVIGDAYLLNALDNTEHDIIPSLEAVPGVNTMLDSQEKILSYFEILKQTRFKHPSRLILDRSLNRDLKRLSALSGTIKSLYPQTRIELLANEGCISHCPFKHAHDAHIALSNTGLVKESTWRLNQKVGCHAYYMKHPHTFLKSPFIRPEDQHQYRQIADTLKICGRTRGIDFLKKCIKAYAESSYQGNLLDLMDTTDFLAQRIHIDNKTLGSDFFTALTSCTKSCKRCRICIDLFKKAALEKPITLTSFKDIQ